MKVINKEIEVIAHFPAEGNPIPLRFKLGEKAVNIDKVFDTWEEKKAGIKSVSYKCQTFHVERGEIIPYEVKFDKVNLKWFLYKI